MIVHNPENALVNISVWPNQKHICLFSLEVWVPSIYLFVYLLLMLSLTKGSLLIPVMYLLPLLFGAVPVRFSLPWNCITKWWGKYFLGTSLSLCLCGVLHNPMLLQTVLTSPNRWLIHCFIKKIFTEELVCIKPCAKYGGSDSKESQPLSSCKS